MSQTARQLFNQYRQQFVANPANADKSLLAEAKVMLGQRLQQPELDSDTIRLADNDSIFFWGDKNVTVEVLSRYIRQSLPPEEEAYARERLADNLAMLGRCEETVECQLVALAWAQQTLPQEKLLPLMFDATQAYCWIEVGKGEQWLAIFHDLMANLIATADNRSQRRIYLRTASQVLCQMGNGQEALPVAQQILDLSEEDATWGPITVKIDAYTLQIRAYSLLQDIAKTQQVGKTATALLENYFRKVTQMEPSQQDELRAHYHTLASSLYFARQYELAIPLFRRAVEMNSYSEHTYFWFAASVWAITKDRSEVITSLKQGANRSLLQERIWNHCCSLPEFQDVVEDAEMKSSGIPAS